MSQINNQNQNFIQKFVSGLFGNSNISTQSGSATLNPQFVSNQTSINSLQNQISQMRDSDPSQMNARFELARGLKSLLRLEAANNTISANGLVKKQKLSDKLFDKSVSEAKEKLSSVDSVIKTTVDQLIRQGRGETINEDKFLQSIINAKKLLKDLVSKEMKKQFRTKPVFSYDDPTNTEQNLAKEKDAKETMLDLILYTWSRSVISNVSESQRKNLNLGTYGDVFKDPGTINFQRKLTPYNLYDNLLNLPINEFKQKIASDNYASILKEKISSYFSRSTDSRTFPVTELALKLRDANEKAYDDILNPYAFTSTIPENVEGFVTAWYHALRNKGIYKGRIEDLYVESVRKGVNWNRMSITMNRPFSVDSPEYSLSILANYNYKEEYEFFSSLLAGS